MFFHFGNVVGDIIYDVHIQVIRGGIKSLGKCLHAHTHTRGEEHINCTGMCNMYVPSTCSQHKHVHQHRHVQYASSAIHICSQHEHVRYLHRHVQYLHRHVHYTSAQAHAIPAQARAIHICNLHRHVQYSSAQARAIPAQAHAIPIYLYITTCTSRQPIPLISQYYHTHTHSPVW